MTTLVDTSALYALVDETDEAHEIAHRTFAGLLHGGEPLLTHNYVVLESAALIQRRLGLDAVRTLRDALLGVMQQVWIEHDVHERAFAATLATGRRALSLVDQVSFELMRSRAITRAFAFDDHFAQEGFELVAAA